VLWLEAINTMTNLTWWWGGKRRRKGRRRQCYHYPPYDWPWPPLLSPVHLVYVIIVALLLPAFAFAHYNEGDSIKWGGAYTETVETFEVDSGGHVVAVGRFYVSAAGDRCWCYYDCHNTTTTTTPPYKP